MVFVFALTRVTEANRSNAPDGSEPTPPEALGKRR